MLAGGGRGKSGNGREEATAAASNKQPCPIPIIDRSRAEVREREEKELKEVNEASKKHSAITLSISVIPTASGIAEVPIRSRQLPARFPSPSPPGRCFVKTLHHTLLKAKSAQSIKLLGSFVSRILSSFYFSKITQYSISYHRTQHNTANWWKNGDLCALVPEALAAHLLRHLHPRLFGRLAGQVHFGFQLLVLGC
jgi:hypothetical protein